MSSDNSTMWVSGTHPNEQNPESDYYTDFKLAIGQLTTTKRFRQAEYLYHLYKPQRIVGHSLGSSIVKQIYNRNKDANPELVATYYNSPFTFFTKLDPNREKSYSHRMDPIAVLDTVSERSWYQNPHSYYGHRR